MKQTKRTAILFALSLCILTTQAQEKENKWTLGLKAGLAFTDDSYSGSSSSLILGATVEYDLGNQFFLRSGLEFMDKTASADGNRYDNSYVNKEGQYVSESNGMYCDLTATFLQIPINVGYRIPVSTKVNLTLKGGIFVDIGLWSDGYYSKWNSLSIRDNEGQTIVWKDEHQNEDINDANNWDLGLMAGIGIEYRRFSYDLNYEHGLIDQSIKRYKDIGGSSSRNKAVSLSATYRF